MAVMFENKIGRGLYALGVIGTRMCFCQHSQRNSQRKLLT